MTAQFERYPNERRRSPRISGAGTKVEYFADGDEASATKASVKDICIHGICIYVPEVIETKKTMFMNIVLAGSEIPIRVQGVVVWYSGGDRVGYYNVGIEFEKISEEDQKKLSDHIEANLKGP